MTACVGVRSSYSTFRSLRLADEKFRQHSVEFVGLFDLWLMGGVHETMHLRTGDDFLEVDVPVALIEGIMLARHDQKGDFQLR